MTNLDARIERAKKEISGNESLFEMLEADSATEMFNWGLSLAALIAKKTEGLDEPTANEAMAPRLKALRQALRSVGNWAAGKYTDPAARLQLKGKLLEQFQLILGESVLISPVELNRVIDSVDTPGGSPHPLILAMKAFIEKPG
jgi:hypothetical protein